MTESLALVVEEGPEGHRYELVIGCWMLLGLSLGRGRSISACQPRCLLPLSGLRLPRPRPFSLSLWPLSLRDDSALTVCFSCLWTHFDLLIRGKDIVSSAG